MQGKPFLAHFTQSGLILLPRTYSRLSLVSTSQRATVKDLHQLHRKYVFFCSPVDAIV